MYKAQEQCIRQITDFKPEIAIVLGSGLGELATKVEIIFEIDYKDIPNMPVSSAPSHKGRFVFCKIGDKNAVLMDGRVHLYEGLTPSEVVAPIRLLKELGVETIILTNAAGGINKDFSVGDLMIINDHISCFIDSPLIGKNDDELGVRFPDMSNAYDKDIRSIAKRVAFENGISIKQGTYVQLKGPQFETPAEIKMLGILGADAVGMSTVIEAIAANHCGMRVFGVSMISNLACGILDKPLSSEDVNDAGKAVAPKFQKFITELVRAL